MRQWLTLSNTRYIEGSTPEGKLAIALSSNRCIEATTSANGTRRSASATPIWRIRITNCSNVPARSVPVGVKVQPADLKELALRERTLLAEVEQVKLIPVLEDFPATSREHLHDGLEISQFMIPEQVVVAEATLSRRRRGGRVGVRRERAHRSSLPAPYACIACTKD